MATFLDRYLRDPLADLLQQSPQGLPELRLTMESERVLFALGDGEYEVARDAPDDELLGGPDEAPEDAPDRLAGI